MSTYALPSIQDNGLSKYIKQVSKFPMLEEKDEYNLAVQYKENGDVKAAHKLVTSHLRLVVKIAMKFRGYGLPITDVISEGNIGLMQAVKKFEPEKGFRLSTYAMWWIKASINEYVLKSWSIVKVGTSATQKKLFFNLKRLKNKITDADNKLSLNEDDINSIATDLNVSAKEVKEMDMLMSKSNKSLNTAMYEEGEGDQIDYLVDESSDQEVTYNDSQELDYNRGLLFEAIHKLNDREKDILTRRRLIDNPLTLEDLSQAYNISRERVRQIENKAVEKLQKYMVPKKASV